MIGKARLLVSIVKLDAYYGPSSWNDMLGLSGCDFEQKSKAPYTVYAHC